MEVFITIFDLLIDDEEAHVSAENIFIRMPNMCIRKYNLHKI